MGTMEVVKAGDAQLARPVQESVFLPVMSMDVAVERRETIIKFVKQIMVQDQDFGVIPGTSSKPVLLKPGAEKLCNFFGLEPEFTPIFEEADWTGERHNGEPFYYIRYRCRLMKHGQVLGVGEGSCNSWESKYRYRNANRKCPECAGEFIIKGKDEYGGGWLCFKKKGGCGAKFADDDKRIVDQAVGKVLNPDMADTVNTIQKMAQKRALVPATLLATSGSEFFTQDLEDQEHAPEPPSKHDLYPESNRESERRWDEQERKRREQRKAEESTSVPAQTAGQKGEVKGETEAGRGTATSAPVTSSDPAPPSDNAVPVQLRAIFERLHKGGYGREALRLVKNWMIQAMPAAGEGEHARLVRKWNLEGNGAKLSDLKSCLLEMYRLIEWARAQKAQTVEGEFQATNEDLPAGLFLVEEEPAYGPE